MEIAEAFGRTVNLAQKKGVDKALELLELSSKKIEGLLRKNKFLIEGRNFDIVIDKKDKLKQLNIYLTKKEWSKKLLSSVKKSSDFKSMVVYLGDLSVLNKIYELRLGAFGVSTQELVKAMLKFKK